MKRKKNLSIEEQQKIEVNDFVSLIAPSAITFRANSRYFIHGNTYRSVWAIRGYPSNSNSLAILRELGEADGITLHIYARPLPKPDESKIIQDAQRRNSMKSTDTKMVKASEAYQNMEDIQKLLQMMIQSREPLYHCAVFIEIIADSVEKLIGKQSTVSSILSLQKILVDKLICQQKEAFNSVKPNGVNVFKEQFERIMPVSSVANLFPFSYSGKTDPHGFYIGKDEGGSNIIVDFDRRAQDKTNGHILVLGNSGEGKSYLMKLLIENAILSGKKVYILDPDDEYKDLTISLGGTYIDMMATDFVINVLEPRIWTKERKQDCAEDEQSLDDEFLGDEPPSFKQKTRLSQHIAYLRDFFKVFRNFSDDELDTIEEMLIETYKRARITIDTDLSQLKPRDYPILSNLFSVIEDRLLNYEDDYKQAIEIGHPLMYTKELLQNIGRGLKPICTGTYSSYFNGVTNIPNANFIDFSVKSALTTNDNLKNAMFLNIFSFMSHKFLTEGDCNLFIDELHEFVNNETAIRYINSFMKRGRKKNSGVCIGSQNVEDLMKPQVIHYTKPLMLIPSHSFLFNPGGNCNPKEYQAYLNLKSYEYSSIDNPNRGHCLYKSGNERFRLHVIAPEHKSRYFGNAGGE